MKTSTLSSANFTEGNILLKERTINNKIKLHILGVPMNKLGNWLIIIITYIQLLSNQLSK